MPQMSLKHSLSVVPWKTRSETPVLLQVTQQLGKEHKERHKSS